MHKACSISCRKANKLFNSLQRTVLPRVVGYAICFITVLIMIRMWQEEINDGKNTLRFGQLHLRPS